MIEQYLQNIPPQIYVYLTPGAIVLIGLLLAFLCEKIIPRVMIRLAAKTKWKGDDAIFRSFKGMIFIWITCAAVYQATLLLPISADQMLLVRQLLTLVVIATLTILAARAAIALINLYSTRITGIFASTSIFSNITKVVIFIIGLLIGLQTLGISIAPILAALGVGGLAVALALQDSLSNLFAGLHIIASSQVKPGDFVKLDNGEQGYVEDITWRNTTIRALSKYLIIIPNSKLASSMVLNFSQTGKELTVVAEVTVSYDNDLEKVEKVTLETAAEIMKNVPGGVPDYTPEIRYNVFGDANLKFNVLMRGRKFVDQYLLKHEFLKKLHERFRAEGINFTAPVKAPVQNCCHRP
jgi:small-conductance mechanosensitive channel